MSKCAVRNSYFLCLYNDNVGWCNWYFDFNKGLCNQYEGVGGHPYHTECVSQLVDHFKAIKKICEKTGNRPNLSKGGGGGTPPLVKNQTISGLFIWRFP